MTKNMIVQNAMAFEGMTGAEALALMDLFIKRAVKACGASQFAEFGAYKGRTACLMAQNLGVDGALEVVESADYLQIDRLLPFHTNIRWHKEKSEDFTANRLPILLGERRLTATHHDASHFFSNVSNELVNIQHLMDDCGVIILDDFNDVYAQVRAAYYYLRYTTNFPFEILLIGFNKCFLVHQDRFLIQEEFILDELVTQLQNDYGHLCRLSRTDNHPRSRGFCVTRRATVDAEVRYGTTFFGDRFYQRSK